MFIVKWRSIDVTGALRQDTTTCENEEQARWLGFLLFATPIVLGVTVWQDKACIASFSH